MRFKIFTLLLLIGILTSQRLCAQYPLYQFSHLDITNGLSNNNVNCIFKDANGFMWFGTDGGLNRYDGYKFKVFKHNAAAPNSLPDNFINNIYSGPENKLWIDTRQGICIYNSVTEKFSNDVRAELARFKVSTNQLSRIKKDRDGNFWFLTVNKGIYCYYVKNHTTVYFSNSIKSPMVLHSNIVTDIIEDSHSYFWLIYNDGVIEKLDTRTNTIPLRSYGLAKANNNKLEPYSGILDNNNYLWIYALGSSLGVYCYHTNTDALVNFNSDSGKLRLNSNLIFNIILGQDNKIWVGTDHGGINLIDPLNNNVQYILNRDDDNKSLRSNCVILYKDDFGIIWAGTKKYGVSYYHKQINQFPLIRHYISDNTSLPFEDINCFKEESNGTLWIGTNGGGLINYNPVTKKYVQYKYDPKNPNSISNDIVISLCIDHEAKLWVGTYFGGLNRFDGKKFIHYRHSDNNPSSVSDDRVYSVIEDSGLRLWVGTFSGNINIFNRKSNSFLHPHYNMLSDYTAAMYEDKQKNIWIARDKGIDVIEKNTGLVKHYVNQPKNSNSLIFNNVNGIFQDKSGLFWITTKGGLSILNAQTNKFYNLKREKNLPDNLSNTLEDKTGKMWISTADGLVCIKPIKTKDTYKFQISRYDEFDGLQGREFNLDAALKTKSGQMIFGGPHGFNQFDPENINTIGNKPKLLLTDFQLYNKSINAGDTINGNIVLKRSITETSDLTLTHNENVFSIEFAACDYLNPNKIAYQYKLESFDKEWLSAENSNRKATYTNLDAGDYVFKVRASNINNPANSSLVTLNIKVLPPFWKSAFAYVLYLIIAVSILLYVRYKGILKLKKEFEMRHEKLEAERKIAREREESRRMHELDLMKIKFFTNVSHEFRTPLSLIISPLDSLISKIKTPEHHQQLLMIKRNGKRLLNLVNQLLDFRKMEFKELKLNASKDNIIEFLRDVCSSFTDIANQNHISFLFNSDIEFLTVNFDHDKIERVLFNLLSNAFKFTPSGGHISVLLSLLDEELPANDQKILEIKVIDSGIGIPKEKLEKVFDRFFQDNLPESLLNQGSGIGLSITREFVKMHGGEIIVESEPCNGSCFIILLPVGVEDEDIILVNNHDDQGNGVLKAEEHVFAFTKKPAILLIEDNDDLRFYLKDNLKHNFHIIEAVNGKDGWKKALALHPNLIVSDVSMPEMNGMELCKKLKADKRTAHLPIILLTALTEEADQLTGLDNGASDYITKPFNFEILLSKINSLLLMQKTLKKTYQKQVEIHAQDVQIISEDEKFLKNAFACIEKNITNPNFSVEELSRQLSLSRVSLYKKLLSLTGKTPVDCIRTIRLKKAIQLLEKSKLSIANVAYEVGFNNPTYFSKVFKDEYNMLPSEYVNQVQRKEKECLETVV
jgi:signal transduction histidine kinase/ligand-binding sensor domain-containing protein/DNA-binding response OmpR family regulator